MRVDSIFYPRLKPPGLVSHQSDPKNNLLLLQQLGMTAEPVQTEHMRGQLLQSPLSCVSLAPVAKSAARSNALNGVRRQFYSIN